MKKSMKVRQPEFCDAVLGQLPPLVADDGHLEVIAGLEPADQVDHLRKGLRLGVHEVLEVLLREGALVVEDHPVQVLVEAQLSLFVGVEGEMVPLVHLVAVQGEALTRHSSS